jgi:hypothetical protein
MTGYLPFTYVALDLTIQANKKGG